MSEARFLKNAFASYYARGFDLAREPKHIDRREFGFTTFGEKLVIRHRRFSKWSELRDFVNSLAPADIMCSTAIYERPDEPMERKGWLGAELVFDIDADHVGTDCLSQHTSWFCPSCGESGWGLGIAKCPACGGKVEEIKWFCENCLEAAKQETIKLLDFLENDFGFSESEILLCFSGHRGFHVHVLSDEVMSLDQQSRKEIVDYLLGVGLDFKALGFAPRGKPPMLTSGGWRGRVARRIYDLLFEKAREDERIPPILEKWSDEMPVSAVLEVLGREYWKLLERAKEEVATHVDSVVTTDLHRIMRLPGTLHGKTGLLAKVISPSEIDSFDPFVEAVVLPKSVVSVSVKAPIPEIRLWNEAYGPFERGQRVDAPKALGVLLIAKGAAKLVE